MRAFARERASIMTCLDFQNRVQELLDRRQRELPNELLAHATHCVACHEVWQHLLRLHDAATACRTPRPTALLADKILQHLQIEQSSPTSVPARSAKSPLPGVVPHRHAPQTRLAAMCLSALTLLIAIGIGWRVSRNVDFVKRQTPSSNAMAVVPIAPPESANDRQLDVLLHDAREAYLVLASQAWQQVSAADLLLPPADAAAPFKGDGATQGVPEPLSRPLAPLGEELREAVDSWFQQVFQSQDSST